MSGLGLTFLRRGGQAHPTAGSEYIKFADEEVFRILMSKGVSSDGVGITKEDAASYVGNISFQNNATIRSFSELRFFTSIESLPQFAFLSCTNLETIDIANIKELRGMVFSKCAALSGSMIAENLDTLVDNGQFENTGLTEFIAPRLNRASNNFLRTCPNLTSVFIPMTDIGATAFYANANLRHVVINQQTPATIGNMGLYQSNNAVIYVPDAVVETWKTATGWTSFASRIKGISSLVADAPEFYTKIQQYL